PALRALANTPVALPAVIFWTGLGGACVLPLERARKFYREELLPVLERGPHYLNEAIESVVPRQRIKRILHLSDLHFGQPETLSRRSWLKQELRRAIAGVDRVVVTGDLFDEPRAELRETFDEFRLDVEFMTGNDLLVIPGNHDVRERGNAWGPFGRNSEQVVDLRWNPMVVDDDMRTVFFSFNSAESKDFAHGHVGERQRLDRATLFDRELHRKPDIADYMRVALVHHHPYQYETEPGATYERIIKKLFGKTDFTSFEGAEEFLRWCAARQVSLVLHGHKHVPHFIEADVQRPGGGDHRLTVIGCGSSTGVGERPMSYDIVTIDVDAKRSSVSFYLDEGADGGGFRLQNVAVDLR
ncbi:MAG: metallophosphoesterase, partial [Verrucomicrobiaceae bacterium]